MKQTTGAQPRLTPGLPPALSPSSRRPRLSQAFPQIDRDVLHQRTGHPGGGAVLAPDEIEFANGGLFDGDEHDAFVAPRVKRHARQRGNAQARAHEALHRLERPGVVRHSWFETHPTARVDELRGDVERDGGEDEILLGEFGEVHHRAGAEDVVPGHRQEEVLGSERDDLQGLGRSRRRHHGEVHGPLHDSMLQFQVASLEHMYAHAREVAAKGCQQPGDHVGGNGRVGAHAYLTGLHAQVLTQDAHRLIGSQEDRLSKGKKQAAVGGEGDLAMFAVEQLGAQFYLQPAHLIAEGRLRDSQDLCRLGEAQRLGDGHVVLELAQFHTFSITESYLIYIDNILDLWSNEHYTITG